MESLPIAGQIVVSVMVNVSFWFGCWAVFFSNIPLANSTLAQMMLGAMVGEWVRNCGFWTSSNISGQRKDATIADQGKMLANSTPTPGQ